MKGVGWYWSQPLLHAKLGLFAAMWLMSLWPTRAFLRWRRVLVTTGALPPEAEVRAARRWIMIETHLLGVLLLAAAFLARGVGTRG
jgi:putative membrane protein